MEQMNFDVVQTLEDEIERSTQELKSFTAGSDEYKATMNYLNSLYSQWNDAWKTLKDLNQLEADCDIKQIELELKEREIVNSADTAEKTMKAEEKNSKKDFWLTVGKCVLECSVPIFLAVTCWNIESEGSVRSKAWPGIWPKFKL